MNLRRTFKLITLLQNRHTSYRELAEFLFGETPPPRSDFLSRVDLSCITQSIHSPAYHTERTLVAENPRDQAKVCFLIRYPVQYYLYESTYRHLSEAEFVVDAHWIRRNIPDWYNFLERFINFLKKKDAAFRLLKSADDPKTFFDKYTALIFNTRHYYIEKGIISGKKIRIMYGHSKDSYNFGPWSRYYDLALTYGPYSHKLMSNFTKSVVVGNARFDDWFSGSLDAERIAALCRRLDPQRRTLLYLPTHGNLSSLDFMAKQFADLTKRYNLIVRPHPNTWYYDPEKIGRLQKATRGMQWIHWVDDFEDLLTLLAVSDAVVSDNSGAIFDAVLADKPVVLIDTLPEDYFRKSMWNVATYPGVKDARIFPLTYPDSIEQRVKREKNLQVGEVVASSDGITAAVERTLEREALYRVRRQRVRKMLFRHCDGSSGRRAAQAIRDVEKEPPPKWDFLQYAVAEADFYEQSRAEMQIKELQRIAVDYLNLTLVWEDDDLEPITFSVIIPTYNGARRIHETLDSILSQKGIDREHFEVIVVDDGSEDKCDGVVQTYIERFPGCKISYIYCGTNRGPSFARNIGIRLARGKFICFTDDDCTVPKDWLSTFHRSFQENPEIAGVGGWYQTRGNKKESLYDRFIYWMTLPRTSVRHKSPTIWFNACGNTANVCYRKSALLRAGGFNHLFGHPSLDDWELKIRMHRHRFVLLYQPSMVRHRKHHSIISFLRYSVVRGWARFFVYKMHGLLPAYYNVSLVNVVFQIIYEWRNVITEKDHEAPLSITEKITFPLISVISNAATWFGKYWIPLELIARRRP